MIADAPVVTPCATDLCGILGEGGVLARGTASAAASATLTALSHWVAGGATWLVRHVVALVAPTTRVHLGSVWFADSEARMLEIAALLICPLLAVATIGAILRQDGRRLVRIFAVGGVTSMTRGFFSKMCLTLNDLT